jgi:predicted metalloprotease with PDZ domain
MSNTYPHYRIWIEDPRSHRFEVALTLAATDTPTTLSLPAWIPGSYLIRDFAKHLHEVRCDKVELKQIDKQTWTLAPHNTTCEVRYVVHAFDRSVRTAYLDHLRGFFNGSSLFLQVEHAHAYSIEIAKSSDPSCADWSLATSLNPVEVDARGFGHYLADDYLDLIDHPVEMGALLRRSFIAANHPHELVLSGAHADTDIERICTDLAAICEAEVALWGELPLQRPYVFLTALSKDGYGGLEHTHSCALLFKRDGLPRKGEAELSDDYRDFLALCAHEYFHLWNIKRLKPSELSPPDLSREVWTRQLWLFEGITSYYDELLLLRSQRIDASSYLEMLARALTRYQRTPGRLQQDLETSSLEAWTKFYQQEAHSPNYIVSYYLKGAIVALLLDLHLGQNSQVTLDDVLQGVWLRYGKDPNGLPEGAWEQIASEVSGIDLSAFFDQAVRSTDELDVLSALHSVGVQTRLRPTSSSKDRGGRWSDATPAAPKSWLGVRWSERNGKSVAQYVQLGSPAQRAGIATGDELFALNDQKISADHLEAELKRCAPGAMQLSVFREDQLLHLHAVTETPPLDTWDLGIDPVLDKENPTAANYRRAWLGE